MAVRGLPSELGAEMLDALPGRHQRSEALQLIVFQIGGGKLLERDGACRGNARRGVN